MIQKIIIALNLVLLSFTSSFAQEKFTVFYFGATSCGPCNRPEVIQSIQTLKLQFTKTNGNIDTKFVMVCMDTDIEEGLNFIKKYGYWDEISIGSHYDNELVLAHLSKTDIPGVPHILVFRDVLVDTKYAKIIKERKLAKAVLGGKNIVKWVNSGMKLDKISNDTPNK